MTKFGFAIAGVAMAGASLLMAAVRTDYDHDVDFGKFKTYSWIRIKATDDLWKDRIESAVDAQLIAKGWSKVESGGDASIAAFGATKEQHRTQTFYDGIGGGGWGWRRFGGFGGGGIATTTQVDIPVGTLSVDVFDSQSKKMIWRGDSAKVLSSKPEKNVKKLEEVTEEMFKNFPPHSKG